MKNFDVIKVAIGELGVTEYPSGSNDTAYGLWYDDRGGSPWCAVFLSWCFDKAGIPLENIDSDKGFYNCQNGYNHWVKEKRITITPVLGDPVFLDWTGDKHFDHVGFFLQDNGDRTIMTLEGNTSLKNNSNGGKVMIRRRNKSVCVFVHPEVYDE